MMMIGLGSAKNLKGQKLEKNMVSSTKIDWSLEAKIWIFGAKRQFFV